MFVVTLPASAGSNPRAFAQKAKKAGADILEIRSDLTPAVQPFSSPLPILVSVRGKSDQLVDLLNPAFVDIEASSESAWLPKGAKLILSFHDYEKTPTLSELKKIVQKMCSSQPWMIKLATFITSYKDLLTLSDLQDFLNKKSIRSTVLGMGPKAHLSRIASPIYNVFTYATLEAADAAAPGQLPMSLYSLTKGRKKPKRFGILGGAQITASLSPMIHNALFLRHKIDALYSCFPTEDFASTLTILEMLQIKGLSVTSPFKHDAFDTAEACDTVSKKLHVANTLVRFAKHWKGYNTDYFGIREGYPALASAKTIAILGAGGAVPSVILALRDVSPKAQITVFARDPAKARKALHISDVSVDALKNAASVRFDAVICAISDDLSFPLPSPVSRTSVAIDLPYGKETRFMKDARAKKFKVYDGIPMLIHQALQQFRYFTGKAPKKDDAEYLSKALQDYLSSSR